MHNDDFQPVDAAKVPRFAGHATFMRLPAVTSAEGLDIALIGIPWDGGTTNRAGARHGPREVRNYSSLMRSTHHVSKTEPFKIANIADVGDVAVNPINLPDGLKLIEEGIAGIIATGALPLCVGGDHLTTLPVLRAVASKGPVGLVHFDAHSDTNDTYFGANSYTHGTPFRRAIEEGLMTRDAWYRSEFVDLFMLPTNINGPWIKVSESFTWKNLSGGAQRQSWQR